MGKSYGFSERTLQGPWRANGLRTLCVLCRAVRVLSLPPPPPRAAAASSAANLLRRHHYVNLMMSSLIIKNAGLLCSYLTRPLAAW